MEKKNKTIVITTIFNPTEAVIKFSKMIEYNMIVVGDKKTPNDWNCDNVEYLSIDKQEKLDYSLIKVLPYNHYCRKMIGYLEAIKNGSEYIYETDDDNIPKDNWGFPSFNAKYVNIFGVNGFINIYQMYTKKKIWARGLPLNLINTNFKKVIHLNSKISNVGIWQGLADGDPDVDAIYRLTDNTECIFENKCPMVLEKGVLSPFNTQNTLIKKELFPLLYLPSSVTFRFTDILRGYVAQPIMWLYDYNLGFINATVFQKRNEHDYFKDFNSEIPIYQYADKVIELVQNVISKEFTIEENLLLAYKELEKFNIVKKEEITTLTAWLEDIKNLK